MSKGVIYVLTNPSFPEYVKIGYADNLEQRMNQLNQSECLPFAFRAYCIYEVEERLKDKDVHTLIDKLNPGLRAIETFDGKPRVREFYNMSAEDAYQILYSISAISGTTSKLKKVKPEGHEILDETIATQIQEEFDAKYTEEDHFEHTGTIIKSLYLTLRNKILALGNVTIEPKKCYIAFKTSTNICDVMLQRSRIKLTINLPKGKLDNKDNLLKDITNVGHWGNGDYLFELTDEGMIDYAISLVKISYEDKEGK